MKRRRTRLLSILLTAVMVLTMVPMTAFATDETTGATVQIESTDVGLEGNSVNEDSVNGEGNNSATVNEAQIVTADGTHDYATVQEAINAATEGQTVTLLQDVAGGFSINGKTNLTVDGNGHTVGSVNFGGEFNDKVTLKNVNFDIMMLQFREIAHGALSTYRSSQLI